MNPKLGKTRLNAGLELKGSFKGSFKGSLKGSLKGVLCRVLSGSFWGWVLAEEPRSPPQELNLSYLDP